MAPSRSNITQVCLPWKVLRWSAGEPCWQRKWCQQQSGGWPLSRRGCHSDKTQCGCRMVKSMSAFLFFLAENNYRNCPFFSLCFPNIGHRVLELDIEHRNLGPVSSLPDERSGKVK